MSLYTALPSQAPTSSGSAFAMTQIGQFLTAGRALAAAALLSLSCLAVSPPALAAEGAAAEKANAADAMMQEMVMGDPDAPVTIVEYASLTCPHCATFHTEVLPELKKEYIDTGKVKLIFRDFPFDRFALTASMLARCSGPDRYFPFLSVLFKQQANWIGSGQPDEVLANLQKLAGLAGMDEAAIKACLGNEALSEYVLNERLTGNKEFGVESTPTLIIGGTPYPGVRRMEELRGIIDPLLPAEMKESRTLPDDGAGNGTRDRHTG